MGKGYHRGLIMALLFGVGLTITITAYTVAVALVGKAVGLDRAIMVMFIVAGAAAYLFGLAELQLVRFRIPGGWGGGVPEVILRQSEYLKALGMGLFLGNAGIGCPNPATYVLLGYVAATGDPWYGAALGAVNGVGRAVPLVFLSILAILGVNAAQPLLKKKELVDKGVGWGLVGIGAIILTLGIYGHYWLLKTGTHEAWNELFAARIGGRVAEYSCCIEPPCTFCLSDGMWGPNTCRCLPNLQAGRLENVCAECQAGLAEGRGVLVIAERTYVPALATLAGLIIVPIPWYFLIRLRRRRRERLHETPPESGGATKGG